MGTFRLTVREVMTIAKRVCFPDGGRDYTDAKEELAQMVLKYEDEANHGE